MNPNNPYEADPNIRPTFAKGQWLKHISNVVGIATGEALYDTENPQEKTKIILKGGAAITDYGMKFVPSTEEDKEKFYVK